MPLISRCLCAFAMLWALSGAVWAQSFTPLPLDGEISADGRKLQLSWEALPGAKVTIFRRALGDRGKDTWRMIAPDVVTHSRFLDRTVEPGKAYEYKVELLLNDKGRVGYWAAGRDVRLPNTANVALLVVDETLADALKDHLNRFQSDLIGAGYRVSRILAPRGDRTDAMENIQRAIRVRQQIAGQVNADPFSEFTVILVGHVPIIRTGRANPDGHEARSVPSDLMYADPVGDWPGARNAAGEVQFAPSTLPADNIAMQIGRIDFSNLSSEFGEELALLRAYFDKNHAFRHTQRTVPARAYGQSVHLEVEQAALRNIVGPRAIIEGGHHDTSDQGPFLLGVDFGEWDWHAYYKRPPSTAVFTINFGSRKHEFDLPNNPMTALLSQPTYPLAVGWGGRPAWQLHGLAMGESIGSAHLRTVNNGTASKGGMASREYVPTGRYDWVNPTWVNLLGDPTLTAFPVPPVQVTSVTEQDGGVRLTWRTPESVSGAIVYRASDPESRFLRISGRTPVTSGEYLDNDPEPGAIYMIRALAMQQVHAGSFEAMSQGFFVRSPM